MNKNPYIYGSSGHGRFARAFPVGNDGGYDNLFYDSPTIQSRYLKHKQYELKDHLGNVRVVVSDFKKNNNPANSNPPYYAEVLAAYNYYPFGMLQPGMYKEGDTTYRFGFNGMLRDDDMTDKLSTGPPVDEGRGNSYDFGARMYNPRVTRFFSLDPLRQSYTSISPFSFALNTPTNATDPDGKIVIFVNGYRYNKDRVGGGFKNDKFNYWGTEFVNNAVNRLGDENVYFMDGNGGLKTSADILDLRTLGVGPEFGDGFQERKQMGKDDAKTLIMKIHSGEVEYKTGETIKIFAHSMGYAHAEGMAEEFIKQDFKVEVIYAIAAEGAKFGEKPKGVGQLKQYIGNKDLIVPPDEIKNRDEVKRMETDHSIKEFKEIFSIKKGETGYVEPRKDGQSNSNKE